MWWLAQDGTILVDGIETASDSAFGGVIVNLTGEHVRLSVDRRRIISLSEQVLDERLRAALPTLIAEGHSLLGMEWLWWLAQIRPTVADWLLPAVLEHGVAPPLPSGKCFDLEVAGCFYPDIQLLAGSPWMTDEGRSHVGTVGSIPDEIAAWRLASLVRAGVTISGLRVDSLPLANKNLSTLPALPSDCELLLIDSKPYDTRWVMRDTPVPAGHVFKVAESLRRPVPAVCDRLRELGYAVPDEASLLADRTLASRNLDGKAPWRVSTSPLTAKELSFIAERLGVERRRDRRAAARAWLRRIARSRRHPDGRGAACQEGSAVPGVPPPRRISTPCGTGARARRHRGRGPLPRPRLRRGQRRRQP